MSFDVNQDIWACRETFLSYKNDAEKSLKKENYTEKEASQHNGGSLVAWRRYGLQGPIGFFGAVPMAPQSEDAGQIIEAI